MSEEPILLHLLYDALHRFSLLLAGDLDDNAQKGECGSEVTAVPRPGVVTQDSCLHPPECVVVRVIEAILFHLHQEDGEEEYEAFDRAACGEERQRPVVCRQPETEAENGQEANQEYSELAFGDLDRVTVRLWSDSHHRVPFLSVFVLLHPRMRLVVTIAIITAMPTVRYLLKLNSL